MKRIFELDVLIWIKETDEAELAERIYLLQRVKRIRIIAKSQWECYTILKDPYRFLKLEEIFSENLSKEIQTIIGVEIVTLKELGDVDFE